MNFKKTAAAAALLAITLGAHADVTLYGKMDLTIGKFQRSNVKGSDRAKSNTGVESNGSFIGFGASEDLGGNLKASVQLEADLMADTGSANTQQFWGREANISLAGDFGRVTLGRKETPLFNNLVAYNPFGDSGFSPSMQLFAANGFVSNEFAGVVYAATGNDEAAAQAAYSALLDTRFSNSITYATPDINGLSASVQLGMKEADANGGNVSLNANYVAGPFAAGFGYQLIKTGLPNALAAKDTRWVLGASYDLGAAKLYGQLGQQKLAENVDGTSSANFMQIGAAAPVAADGSAMVSYGQLKGKDSDIKHSMLSVGYDQSLSKRTGVYGVISSEKITDLSTGNTVAVGVRHRF